MMHLVLYYAKRYGFGQQRIGGNVMGAAIIIGIWVGAALVISLFVK